MSRRRAAFLPVTFRVVCSCAAPPVVVARFHAVRDAERRAELLRLHDHPAVFEKLRVLSRFDQAMASGPYEPESWPPKQVAQRLDDRPLDRYEEFDEDAGWRERHAVEQDQEESRQGAREKPLEWRCPKCRRTARLTAKQADTVAHAMLSSGAYFVDLKTLTRTLGDQSG